MYNILWKKDASEKWIELCKSGRRRRFTLTMDYTYAINFHILLHWNNLCIWYNVTWKPIFLKWEDTSAMGKKRLFQFSMSFNYCWSLLTLFRCVFHTRWPAILTQTRAVVFSSVRISQKAAACTPKRSVSVKPMHYTTWTMIGHQANINKLIIYKLLYFSMFVNFHPLIRVISTNIILS